MRNTIAFLLWILFFALMISFAVTGNGAIFWTMVAVGIIGFFVTEE